MTTTLFFSQAATDAQQQQAPGWTSFITMGLLFLLFYFLMIRPQAKARKEQDRLVNALKSGDNVITSSGILGTVTNVKDKTVIVRIADSVKIEVLKSAITTVTKSEPTVIEAKLV